jgi:hypothetical protein
VDSDHGVCLFDDYGSKYEGKEGFLGCQNYTAIAIMILALWNPKYSLPCLYKLAIGPLDTLQRSLQSTARRRSLQSSLAAYAYRLPTADVPLPFHDLIFFSLFTSKILFKVNVNVILRPTVSRPVRLGVRHPSGTRDLFFFLLEIFFR